MALVRHKVQLISSCDYPAVLKPLPSSRLKARLVGYSGYKKLVIGITVTKKIFFPTPFFFLVMFCHLPSDFGAREHFIWFA